MTELLGNNNIKKERGGKYYTTMVPLFPLFFNDYSLLMIIFDAVVQECVLNVIVPVIKNVPRKYVLSYTYIRYLRIILV